MKKVQINLLGGINKMLPIIVNRDCVIVKGPLKGTIGRVVAFDYKENEVKIMLDASTYIVTIHENVEQVAH